MGDNVVKGQLPGQRPSHPWSYMSRPVYLIAASADVSAALTEAGVTVAPFDDPAGLGPLEEQEPGVILIDRASTSEQGALALADRVSRAGAGWVLATLEAIGENSVRTVSLGAPHSVEEVAEWATSESESSEVLMDLDGVLADVARLRHDLNNPLTSALAEIQLMLFDVEDPEVRESLEVAQTQLRRMRDMIAATRHLRPHRL